MKAHIKIIKDDDLSFRKGEDRYIVVSSTNKLLNNCFGHGFCSKESAYFGFNLSKKRYIEWKKKQCNLKNK